MSDDKKKSAFQLALSKGAGGTAGKEGGLGGALARVGGKGLSDIARPQTTDLSKVGGVVEATQKTMQVAQNDHERDMQNRSGVTFVIDATASREHSWYEAQQMQGRMFDKMKEYPRATPLSVICHRGSNVEYLGSFDDAQSAKKKMAGISCVSGHTQIVPSLQRALVGTGGKPPAIIIMVGDAFEEEQYDLEQVARQAKQSKVKIYAFLEGSDSKAARAFRSAADITGGIFKSFGEGLDDAGLADLCVAAATLDMGGINAFRQLAQQGDKGAKALLLEVERKQLGGPKAPGV